MSVSRKLGMSAGRHGESHALLLLGAGSEGDARVVVAWLC